MARTEQYKRRVPSEVQGVVIDGMKLGRAVHVPFRDGMTRTKAVAYIDDLFRRARERVYYRLTDVDAWAVAMAICNDPDEMISRQKDEQAHLFHSGQPQTLVRLQERLNRKFSRDDEARVAQWVERIYLQRCRIQAVPSLLKLADPEALLGTTQVRDRDPAHTHAALATSLRQAAGRTPLHSEVTRDFFAAKLRSHNYRRALEQFREQCDDLPIGEYTADHCWMFRNWLKATTDEKHGLPLSGKTKNNKLSAVSSVFSFAIEARHRNDNPMRDVNSYPRNENLKKHRRLYTKAELTALFVKGERTKEWKWWVPVLAIYAGMRLRESIQLRPHDISNEFGVWHFLVRPGRGQRVKGGQARAVPVHRELVRLGLLDLRKRAIREGREWLFKDVPLVEMPGVQFSASDVETIMVPSQNAVTQWFGRYSTKCGVTDSDLDFHALRGLWMTYGSQQGKNLSIWMELAGHSKGSSVHQGYIYQGSSLKALKAEIDKIVYPITVPKSAMKATA